MSLGRAIGQKLKGGEVIELVSDLGGGKTSFVKGMADGMGSEDETASPTFTVCRVYKSENLELHHFDFYRLDDGGIVAIELLEAMSDPKVVTAIEWPETVRAVLPKDRLTITIKTVTDNGRKFIFSAGKDHRHLIEGL